MRQAFKDEDGRLDQDGSRILIFFILTFAGICYSHGPIYVIILGYSDPICKYVSCGTLCATSNDRSKKACLALR